MHVRFLLGAVCLCIATHQSAAHDTSPTELTGYSFKEIQHQYTAHKGWGLAASIDLNNCIPERIRSADAIRTYVATLCKEIDMKPFGNMQLIHFGQEEHIAGYSMTQLIETSLISGHFANATNKSYIDIFSCKLYDPYLAAEFTKEFFGADSYELHITLRLR